MATLQPYNKYYPVAYDYVTQLPDGWQLLPNIAIFQERRERPKNEMELLSVSISKGVVRQSDMDKKDISSQDKSNYKVVRINDIAYGMEFRKGAVGYSNYEGIVSPVYTVLKPRKNRLVNPKFFHYVFRTEYYKNYIWRNVYGIGEHFLPCRFTHFKRMYSIVPPLSVQNSIVSYLDKKNEQIDTFIRNKERLVEILEERKKDVIDATFTKGLNPNTEIKATDIDWLTSLPKNWSLKRLKFLTKIISKGSTPSTEGREMTSEGIRFIKAENIFKSNVTEEPAFFIDAITHRILKRSQLQENDLLFVIAGATIGKVAILPKEFLPANTNQAVSFIRLKKKVDVEFCYYWLHSNFITTSIWLKAVTSAQPNLAMEDLGNLSVPYPSDTEKEEIVKFVKEEHQIIDLAITKAQKEISAIKEYRESLITDLVTGKRSVPQVQMS
ncbi:MAG: restriction endonuclease subunit S [Bacteroidetes bacterium]|nr:restriction endonuclease subunit S [Bacteroidota bacterium]